jgi:acetylornithine deacetylase/succinyl-diaminopimelate desuccinylase-like protein
MVENNKIKETVEAGWDKWVEGLADFVRVPNLSPMVDPEFLTNGNTEKAMEVVDQYAKSLNIEGLVRHVIKPEGSSNLIVYVHESDGPNCMFYGHLDKQPHGDGWDEDKHPTNPTFQNGWMYGRGSSDDGYAAFSTLLAMKAAQESGKKLPRIALVLETEEESGSPNLLKLLDLAKDLIKEPDYCFCMDSGALDYNNMWLTSSLRGVVIADVTVQCGQINYHSGVAGGIVPESFRVVRELLDRVDNVQTGKIVDQFQPESTPQWKIDEAQNIVNKYGDAMAKALKIVDGSKYMNEDNLVEQYLDNVWRPNLSITGAEGLPPMSSAGNVVRKSTKVRLSMRLSPIQDAKKVWKELVELLTTNVPYGAKVTVEGDHAGSGWCQKDFDEKMTASLNKAAETYFGSKCQSYGIGGAIPFLKELENIYPKTQIMALGVLGPDSNAHAPNEGIDLEFTKKITMALGSMILDLSS